MSKKITQLVALVTYANVSLQRHDFDLEPYIAEYCYGIELVYRPAREIAGTTQIIAPDATKWYDYIIGQDAKRVKLRHQSSSSTELPDYITEAFTGGGSDWFIEVQFPEKSELYLHGWVPEGGTVQNPWKTPLVQLGSDLVPLEDLAPSCEESRNRLGEVLDRLIEFASQFEHSKHWVANFENSRKTLSEFEPTTSDEFIPAGIYPKQARQLIEAAFRSWVFGGMGSWTDMAFSGEHQDTYMSLTEQLYSTLCQALVSAVNSYP
ncbi:hypothetical protein EU522_01610 [Candidatus Thorarchaeota archaeon]|nr:MAG: hypothetical protein EU522_01610 [Candidatus Thorarchaeota archaeon]